MNRPAGMDIIIPIYNAYDDLQICVESILKHTDLSRHRLLLVNDASPDERISPYIKSLERENILAIENEKNLGFSGSVNHGMTVSKDRDVLLLNSDTIVTANWIEKIMECAYSDPAIATVTPLSNNATLCSVPDFLMENKIPEGYTLDQFAELVEKVSMKLYPEIPVAHGFCMYIKREVIDRIGLFDAETFERGYGEENDFCYRAQQAGYYHAMCDDTYICHTGTASFISDEKQKLIDAHERVLNERYPEQNYAVALHCRSNPNEQIQDNVKIWTELFNGRKNILYLVQSDFREGADDNIGGTQLHVKDMTEVMREKYNIFVAARNREYLDFTAYTKDKEFTFRFYIGKSPEYTEFRSKKFAELYGKLLDAFRIDMVHIHHTKNLTLEMFYQAKQRNIPLMVTLHDYYTLCPQLIMIDSEGKLCTGSCDDDRCRKCQKKAGKVWEGINYASIWRKEHEQALANADVIFTPSENAKRVVGIYYPSIIEKITVVPHGIRQFELSEYSESDGLNVAFIGGISEVKGSYTCYQLIKNSPNDINWHLFGIAGNSELAMLEKKNYIKTGPYQREELPGLISKYKIDVVCILPLCSETFCYTLSEALMCKVPVIGTDVGALGERLKEYGCGWVVSAENTFEETMAVISRIKYKGEEYRAIKEKAENFYVRNLYDMKADYEAVYDNMLSSVHNIKYTGAKLEKFAVDGYRLAAGKKISMEAEGENIQEHLEYLESQLNAITGSFTYKVVSKLEKLPIPGKRYIKKIVYKLYYLLKRK
ncbi:MAG: glycosyltransferase [Oscillospiraceae bacterium]|nr:glycosyltransferase [Oscillospiraceae bacterium]